MAVVGGIGHPGPCFAILRTGPCRREKRALSDWRERKLANTVRMLSTLRYLRQYVKPKPGRVRTEEITYARGAESLPATVYRPSGSGALPGWVVLHGLTYTGRQHPSLVRFAAAVAAAGNVVLVPDIPEWRALRVAPAVTVDTIRAAVQALQSRADVAHEHAGLFGFSFGATQALMASCEPDVRSLLSGVAAWGGYCDLRRLFDFAMTGEHELDGVEYRVAGDPYGIWIMTGNYLTAMEGFEHAAGAAAALHELALEAGRSGLYAWDPAFDATKATLRARLAVPDREVFDMIAPPTTAPPADPARTRTLARRLAEAVLRVDPLMDPTPYLPRVTVPTLLAHGRDDRLIPFTETLRLRRALPPEVVRGCTITSLFAHSGGTRSGLGPLGLAREGVRFVDLLRRTLTLV
jgi:pimeloyl-ACP methyl ester carboxylesterase